MLLYKNIVENLIGKDRMDALAVIDDDVAFDTWLEQYDRTQRQDAAAKPGAAPKGKPVSKAFVMKRFAKVHGDVEEP